MNTGTASPGPERLAQDILHALRRIMRSLDISSRQLISEYGLTIPQLISLQQLHEHGPLTSGALARTVALSPATVTGILDRLELRGLVTRERRPEDKRRVLVSVTDLGRSVIQNAPSHIEDRLASALATLPETRRVELHRAVLYLAALIGNDSHET